MASSSLACFHNMHACFSLLKVRRESTNLYFSFLRTEWYMCSSCTVVQFAELHMRRSKCLLHPPAHNFLVLAFALFRKGKKPTFAHLCVRTVQYPFHACCINGGDERNPVNDMKNTKTRTRTFRLIERDARVEN